jgi:hypothetical protein
VTVSACGSVSLPWIAFGVSVIFIPPQRVLVETLEVGFVRDERTRRGSRRSLGRSCSLVDDADGRTVRRMNGR